MATEIAFGSGVRGTHHQKSDIDIALQLMPSSGNHNWALANFVEFFEDWKVRASECRQLVRELGCYQTNLIWSSRRDLPGR
ncbi:nucleotidyltransferase domain-containing protein [Bradyrhizobium genosp. P]|uniref:nucleotidyltransferase domain-containing protein n=1 Tax=Bradyrhizobium genosp. P TaxID=83641 RepID=UPI003CF53D1E